MKTLTNKIGYWSALLCATAFIIWIICFIGIIATSEVFYWTNLTDYLKYINTYNQFFQNLAKFFMLIFGSSYVLLIVSFYDHTADEKKILVRISILFATAFAVLISIHYFVQLSAIRLNIMKEQTEGIEHFLQANPISIMSAVNMLGWTLFLGLSSFFIAPVFSRDKLQRILKITFIINGISCILSGIGYVFQIDIITFLFMNLGMGGAVTVMSITASIFFKKQYKT